MINTYFFSLVIQNLSYLPTDEQKKLLELLTDFVFEPQRDSLFLLKGYAGTGKTSLVGALVRTLSQCDRKTVLLAPTGRAAKVFSLYSAHPAFTIHKKIYRQKVFDASFDGFSVADNLHKNTLFIIDEASMVANNDYGDGAIGSGRLLDDLIEYVYAGEGCKLLLIGDSAQLPPVGQLSSPALDVRVLDGYGLNIVSYELTQVVRQAENSGILFNATRLRSEMSESELPKPSIAVDEFDDVKLLSGEFLIETLSTLYNRSGIEECVVITRSNKRANMFNQGIRNQILYREEELCTGDLLMIGRNNYFWGNQYEEIDFLANGDMAQVVRVRSVQSLYGFNFADVLLALPDYGVEIEAKVLLDTLSSESPSISVEQHRQLFERVLEDYAHLRTKRDKMRAIKNDPFYNALQIKYGYAITCHKAQGGQWRNVLIDTSYINPDMLGIDFYRWLYTAFTRATEQLLLLNLAPQYIEGRES